MSEVILKAENVTQRFGGLCCRLMQVNFELRKGRDCRYYRILMAAGKTTFFNDITGVYTPTGR